MIRNRIITYQVSSQIKNLNHDNTAPISHFAWISSPNTTRRGKWEIAQHQRRIFWSPDNRLYQAIYYKNVLLQIRWTWRHLHTHTVSRTHVMSYTYTHTLGGHGSSTCLSASSTCLSASSTCLSACSTPHWLFVCISYSLCVWKRESERARARERRGVNICDYTQSVTTIKKLSRDFKNERDLKHKQNAFINTF